MSHPRRVLLISAAMGAGHYATARAVEQAAYRVWPGCDARWVDALEVMGPGVGPVFRRIYVVNVQTTPWLYEFFYSALWRYSWFARVSKAFVGAWCGRRLAAVVEDYDPDLIISTYPLGSAGLWWLRRRRGMQVPVAAWVPDFAPHPFWVYRDLDVHMVMHDVSARSAWEAEPGAAVSVAAPSVVEAFSPGDRGAARQAVGLRAEAFIAVVSGGFYGFGTVERAVTTLLDTDPRVQVVALCGRNEALRERLAARRVRQRRLVPLGWVDNAATYMRAADVVVANGGGATSLEALASGRASIMFEPIAAHGRANAALMAEAGLTLLCRTPWELEKSVRSLLDDPERQATLEATALSRARARTVADDMRLVGSLHMERHRVQ